jgi:hypothetical protein
LKVTAKNIPHLSDLVQYNGQESEVLSMRRAASWCDVSIEVRFANGRVLSLMPNQYDATPETLKQIDKVKAAPSGPKPAALRRMQRNSWRSAK